MGGFDGAFASYISSYTTGTVSSGTTIRVMLSQPYGDSSILSGESTLKLFRFDPAVKGSTFWLDNRTVEFRPSSRLSSGQLYHVHFALAALFEVPKTLSEFTFPLQVLRQDFALTVDHLYAKDRNDLAHQRLEGLVQTADLSEPGKIEKMLTANQQGKSLSFAWTHSDDGLEHRFLVDEINREQQASTVNLVVEGEVLGVNRRQNLEIEVPSLGDFKLMQARVMPGSNQHVVLSFSDPLKEKQNLDGLIRLGALTDLQFSIRDHEIFVYPNVRQTDSLTVYLEPGIRNLLDKRLEKGTSIVVQFEQLKPAVRFTGRGNIMPGTNQLALPFEAVGLRAVDLEVVKIFEQNILQFLQANQLDGSNELRRVGKVILKKMIKLDETGITDYERWNRYTLDLATLMRAEPGAIYQVRLGFNKNYSTYFCSDQPTEYDLPPLPEDDWQSPDDQEFSYWDSYDADFYNPDYDWQERDNPCHSSYYSYSRKISKNILASDLGIIAKRGGENTLRIFVNSISTTLPVSNVKVEAYNFQRQLLATANTDSEGKIIMSGLSEKPFVLVANDGKQRGYLRIDEGSSLSLSAFDVSGQTVENGIKGFIYGDRGVWRPGDSLHISFILEDKNNILPDDHPVIFEFNNPQNQSVDRQVQRASVNGIYYFGTTTDPEAITGNYLARVMIGGATFSQTMKVETVKPNRLKIQLEMDGKRILAGKNNLKGTLDVRWLHGAPARSLMSEFEIVLSRNNDVFPAFSEYTFSDPTVGFNETPIPVIKERMDANGHLNINATLDNPGAAPGVLNATFRGKVFEEGGDFSIDRFTIPFYPYPAFIGIRSPKGDQARNMLLTDTMHHFDIVRVDQDGLLTGNQPVEVEVHKLEWTWWWENSGNDLANYVTSAQSEPLQKQTVKLNNGKGSWNFRIEYPDWGRYFIRVCDPVSGHCSGKVVYVDWPGWAGRAQRDGADGATMLMLSSDKATYQTGEEAILQIPGSAGGRALISIENGSNVLQTSWIPTQSGDTPFRFVVTQEMSPNIYVHVTLLQEHAQTTNDLPIRLYGIIPIKVEDAATHLKPEISMADELRPGKEVVIRISEGAKRKMSYTVAVVDEGLIDLTRFQTPDPWNRFYAREALGVRTWDLYDQIIGSYGGTLERLLAVGGDEAQLIPKDSDARAQRFKPVVKFLGPFTLEKGKPILISL
ncbi:MAG: hypothetical protein IPL46_15825 [Saprospiraceae bacterium]|nr:hypothetical protein [Saprospiraceae bacterium]